eukprot:TRINITY_DN5432_c0_g1_i1.p2 TRINITY_DN5432_c0_g1~~TRINITY_DN5432_c0_g1_i1.p2  ORF type:complete len:130 (-),score=30.99 TRINITY_DN5432_c0_g1_i1:335-724(-)
MSKCGLYLLLTGLGFLLFVTCANADIYGLTGMPLGGVTGSSSGGYWHHSHHHTHEDGGHGGIPDDGVGDIAEHIHGHFHSADDRHLESCKDPNHYHGGHGGIPKDGVHVVDMYGHHLDEHLPENVKDEL